VSLITRLLRFLDHRLKLFVVMLFAGNLRMAELGGPLGGEALQFGPELGATDVGGALCSGGSFPPPLPDSRECFPRCLGKFPGLPIFLAAAGAGLSSRRRSAG